MSILGNHNRHVKNEIEEAFSDLIHSPWGKTPRPDWHPQIDFYETKDHYVVVADIPGTDPDKVSLSVEKNKLVLCGERRVSLSLDYGESLIVERTSGKFCRSIELKHAVDIKAVSVQFESGVYKAIIPKRKHSFF